MKLHRWGLLAMVVRSLRQHAVSTVITVGSVALAAGLVMAVFSINKQAYDAFTSGHGGFDAVLGARGSQTQLVLNAVFHLETSPGNIPWELYQRVKNDARVEHAVPYALGDNYRGYRIVGTTLERFTVPMQDGQTPQVYEGGRWFDDTRREAVVGSFVAQQTGLSVGSVFQPYHGLVFNEDARHEEEYVVVGIMKPTNTPMDRVIYIPLEGIFRMEGHVLRGSGEQFTPQAGQAIPDEHKEVSAVLLTLRTPAAGMLLNQRINFQGNVATLAWPIGRVMADLFDKIGWMHHVLTMVAYLIVVVSIGAIVAAVYNTIHERRRDIAILRALGARRRFIFSAIVLESSLIALAGSLIGYAVYSAIVGAAAWVVWHQVGVVLNITSPHPALWLTPVAMVLLGALAGLIPALKAYQTEVASHLTPIS